MMFQRIERLPALAGALVLVLVAGCGDDDTSNTPDAATTPDASPAPDSGNESDASPPAPVRVRRSWTSLSPEERKQYIDGVILLKQKTQLRWDYTSLCEGQPGEYVKNAYDYFVEAHMHAFLGMSQGHDPDQPHQHDSGQPHQHAFDAYNRPHMGPHFMPWHRELLLRYEQELRDVLGDPDFMLPYWDWKDPVEAVFSTDDLGSLGTCPTGPGEDFGEVSGYLADEGYTASVTDQIGETPADLTIVCAPKRLTRGQGCLPQAPTLPTAEDEARALEIPTYDVAPFDNLYTDEQLSFRQYVEGYTNEDIDEPTGLCKFAGCQMHGRVHVWVGGLLGSAGGPNDPVFFLLHANIDRIWAEWQDKYGDETYPSAAPDDYTGGMFMFSDDQGQPVQAREMFDQRALGYVYDTQQ